MMRCFFGAVGVILLVGILPGAAQPEWVRRFESTTPPAKAGTLFFLNADQGWLAGTDGHILHTENGGQTWTPHSAGTTALLNGVKFFDANHGMAVGNEGRLLRSVDGGRTWSLRPVPTRKHLRGIYCKDAGTWWVVGDSATILRTTDGGATWTDVVAERIAPDFVQPPGELRSIDFSDEVTGWAVGYAKTVFKTLDGGATWRAVHLEDIPVTMLSVRFSSAKEGMIAGVNGGYRTSDSGRTWRHFPSDQQFGSLSEVFITDGSHAWMVQRDLYFSTEDGMQTATAYSENSLQGFHFLDERKGWALGKAGVFATVDGGKQWTMLYAHSAPALPKSLTTLNSVGFADALHGWAVDVSGSVLQTEDGGYIWSERKMPTLVNPHLVYFIDSQRGWIAGNGKSMRTTNGGARWDSTRFNFGTVITSMHFANPRVGWAATGYGSGYVFRTDDSGLTWSSQDIGVEAGIHSIQFINEQIGWAIGDRGTLLTTVNGGRTWSARTLGTMFYSMRDLHFIDAQRGWIVGDGAEIYRTTDGGATWQFQLVAPGYWKTVRFADALTGWAGGKDGMIQTSDGGQTWEPVANAMGATVSDIVFYPGANGGTGGTGWAVGSKPLVWSLEPRLPVKVVDTHFLRRKGSAPRAGRMYFRPLATETK